MPKTKQPKKSITQRFYKDIRREYSKQSNIKEFGKQKFTDEVIIAKIAYKFYKSEITIENIIFNRV